MANTHSIPKPTIYIITTPERYLKVSYRPHRSNNSVPAINLSGKWLNEAGFSICQPVKLRIMPDCIIITRQDIRKCGFYYSRSASARLMNTPTFAVGHSSPVG